MNKVFEGKIKKDIKLFETVIGMLYDGNNKYDEFKEFKKFNGEIIGKYWEKLVGEIKNKEKEEYLNFYIHIPFCRVKCSYCVYFSKETTNEKIHSDYINYLIKYMQFFSKTFSTVQFKNLFIGGGTPSVLNCKQLERLFSNIFKYYNFSSSGWKVFEINPDSVDEEKLKLLKKYNFNNVSIGVQSLNYEVLKEVNRDYQNYEMVVKTMDLIKKVGFDRVNIDLIIGLKKDTADHFLRSFKRVAAIKPTQITVYPLQVRDKYISRQSLSEYWTFQTNFVREVAKLIKPALKKFNYIPIQFALNKGCYGWGFKLKKEKRYFDDYYNDWYSSLAEKPYSLFGIGPNASSYIYGHFIYVQEDVIAYKFNPLKTLYYGRKITLKYEMLRYIIHCVITKNRIPIQSFKKRFSSDLSENFKYALFALMDLKKINITNNFVNFLSTDDPKDKLFCLIFFIDEKDKESPQKTLKVVKQQFHLACFHNFEEKRKEKNLLQVLINNKNFIISIEKINKKQKYYSTSNKYGFYFLGANEINNQLSPEEKKIFDFMRLILYKLDDKTKDFSEKELKQIICKMLISSINFIKKKGNLKNIDIRISNVQ